MKNIKIFAIILLSLNVLLSPTPSAYAKNKHPNIILVLVDDMGYGDLNCYNPSSQIPTPNLDKLANEGMRFTDAHAAGTLCHPSRYGLLTGQYPFRANPGAWRTKATIAPDRLTIPKMLKSANYQTAMVGKWHLGFNEKTYDDPLPGGPVDRGFDSFFGIRASTDIPPYFYIKNDKAILPPTDKIKANSSPSWSPIQGAFWREGGISPDLKLEEVLPRFFHEADQVLHNHKIKNQHNPLFLYLALPAPHTPWLPTDEFKGKSKASMYGDFVMMVDSYFGRLMETLDALKMAQNSIILFSSDNGPVWYQEDIKRYGHDSTGGFRGMKADAWEGGHRMPFVFKWPGVVEESSICDHTISFVDVLATMAEIVNVPLKPQDAPDSHSFLPLLKQTYKSRTQFRSPLVIKSGSSFMTIRDGDWKLITGLGSGGFSKPRSIPASPNGPKGQLYNLNKDPFETNNLYMKYPEIVANLSKKLNRITSKSVSRY